MNKIHLNETGRVCIYCGHPLSEDYGTVDHIIPKSRGGLSEDFNLIASCPHCNYQKGNMSITRFVRTMGIRQHSSYKNRVRTLYEQHKITKDKMELLLDESKLYLSNSWSFKILNHQFKILVIHRVD